MKQTLLWIICFQLTLLASDNNITTPNLSQDVNATTTANNDTSQSAEVNTTRPKSTSATVDTAETNSSKPDIEIIKTSTRPKAKEKSTTIATDNNLSKSVESNSTTPQPLPQEHITPVEISETNATKPPIKITQTSTRPKSLNTGTLKNKNIYVKEKPSVDKAYPPKDKLNLIHIVKEVDGMTVEFWVDPYKDNVDIDLTFTEPPTVQNKTATSKENDQADASTDSASEEKASPEMLKMSDLPTEVNKQSKTLDSYLSNYDNAHAYFYAKKYEKAHFYIDRAIAIDSGVSYGYRFKGTIMYAEENYEEALRNWKRAVELNPNLTDVKQFIEELENN